MSPKEPIPQESLSDIPNFHLNVEVDFQFDEVSDEDEEEIYLHQLEGDGVPFDEEAFLQHFGVAESEMEQVDPLSDEEETIHEEEIPHEFLELLNQLQTAYEEQAGESSDENTDNY